MDNTEQVIETALKYDISVGICFTLEKWVKII